MILSCCERKLDMYCRLYPMCDPGDNQLTIDIVKVKRRENNYLILSFINSSKLQMKNKDSSRYLKALFSVSLFLLSERQVSFTQLLKLHIYIYINFNT